jgi:hypothetical protein
VEHCGNAADIAGAIQRLGLAVRELEPLFDVDTPADLGKLAEYLLAHPGAAPATRSWYFQQCESASSFLR